MRFRANAKAHIQESDIYPWMSGGGPLSAAFNTFVFKTLMLGRWRTDEKDLFRPDVVGQVRLVARRVYTAVRFDGRIVSFQVSTDDYTGAITTRSSSAPSPGIWRRPVSSSSAMCSLQAETGRRL